MTRDKLAVELDISDETLELWCSWCESDIDTAHERIFAAGKAAGALAERERILKLFDGYYYGPFQHPSVAIRAAAGGAQ